MWALNLTEKIQPAAEVKELGSSFASASVFHVILDKVCQGSGLILSFICLAVTEIGKALRHGQRKKLQNFKPRIPIFCRAP